MSVIKVNTTKTVGKIKPMHAGGQPPLGGAGYNNYFHYLTEAGIPYSRLHDVGGAFGSNRFVDIPNIFRNFDADENDPTSYDFAFTDFLIKSLVDAGVEPYFRLGITIENQAFIRTYYTDPPKDYDKWARICEHVIAHYTEGWADGFYYNITYWEIWNEPDNLEFNGRPSQMWSGTPDDYYRLYDVAAKHLKARFPNIKIGGYASSGFYALTSQNPSPRDVKIHKYLVDFFIGFLEYLRAHNTPLDFFSWHSYTGTKNTLVWERFVSEKLREYGFENAENHLNEWDPYCNEFGTGHHSAEVAAMMLGMQDRTPSVLCIYDMRTNNAPYCPLFNPLTHEPMHAYYSLVAFNHLYKLENQVELTLDTEDMYAVAASDGKYHALMISNLTGKAQPLILEGVDLTHAHISVIDDRHLLSWAPNADNIANNTVMLIEWH
ncbi:MAG: hypothetical protein IJW03_04125 [Clostridia bacterium]|nr:hypothetical protein [Clostridia bacterium]